MDGSKEALLTKRVKRYEKALEILLEDSVYKEKLLDNKITNLLQQSTRLEKNNNGTVTKSVVSPLGDFIIVDSGKDLDELDRVDYKIIKYQNIYKNYKKIEQYTKKFSLMYGLSCTAGKIVSTILFL